MTPMMVAKLALALAGMLVFGYGVRADVATIRWIGIALVAVAVLLRFVPTRPPPG
jgi:Zn-dependent membrane protease YugP